MNNYKNAFTEVHTILSYLEESEYEKIPPEIIAAINLNMNTEYYYEIDEKLDLRNQQMLPETKAILFNLFRDYLSTVKQKEKIIKMQKEERQKNELKKQQNYSSYIFANRNINKTEKEELNLIKYKESFFKKILNYIRKFFHR